MNEQLQKLYEQSFVTDTYVNVGPDGATLGIKFDPEKFAELILHDVLSQNILQAQRVDKDPVCQNYPKEVIATFFYEDMLKRYGVE
jgi:hypothetical protein